MYCTLGEIGYFLILDNVFLDSGLEHDERAAFGPISNCLGLARLLFSGRHLSYS